MVINEYLETTSYSKRRLCPNMQKVNKLSVSAVLSAPPVSQF